MRVFQSDPAFLVNAKGELVQRCSVPGCTSAAARPKAKCGGHLARDREYQAWRRGAQRVSEMLDSLRLGRMEGSV